MDENALKEWAESWIADRVDPERYCSHHLGHVRGVVAEAETLARHAGISETDTALLRTAAYLHDVGYAFGHENHEEESIRIAREILPGFGYRPGEIEMIALLIDSTHIPHRAGGLLEGLIDDADLCALGRTDFPESARLFRRELAANGYVFTERDFWRYERRFLKSFRYMSEAGQKLRSAQFKRNLEWVEQKIANLEGAGGIQS